MDTGDEDDKAAVVSEREACLGLILELRSRGLRDTRLLGAIERVPRRLFLSARQRDLAYVDTQLPIECGQTAPAPTVMARMVEALQVREGDRVLHVGTGSGYQAAILGHLATQVTTLERYRTLCDVARQRLSTLKLANVEVVHDDGLAEPEETRSFERILLSGSVSEVPPSLMRQLAAEGQLVAPVGPAGAEQQLLRIDTAGVRTPLGALRLVPLCPGLATRL